MIIYVRIYIRIFIYEFVYVFVQPDSFFISSGVYFVSLSVFKCLNVSVHDTHDTNILLHTVSLKMTNRQNSTQKTHTLKHLLRQV